MNKLREDAFKAPIYHVAIIAMLFLGLSVLPVHSIFAQFIKDPLRAKHVGRTLLMLILSIALVVLIFKYEFTKPFKATNGTKSFLMVIPALVLSINFLPIVSILNGNIKYVADGTSGIIWYLAYTISLGLFESLLFCGLVFPLLLYLFKDKKYSVIYAALVSAGLFALSNLTGLLYSASLTSTFLHVGFGFLMGFVFAVSKSVTRNLFTAIILHCVYNVGEFLLSKEIGIAIGNMWNTITIVLMVVLIVAVISYTIYLAFKLDHDEVEELYFT